MTVDDVRFNNFFMATGRIGVAILLVPPIWIMAFLLIFSDEPSREAVAFGIFLSLLGAVLTWTVFRVPLWVAVTGDKFLVRYLLGTSTFDVNDIGRIRSGTMISTIGSGTRRYAFMTFVLKNRKSIRVLFDQRIVSAIQSRSPNVRRN